MIRAYSPECARSKALCSTTLGLRRCTLESLIGIKPAGAAMVISYLARDAAAYLPE
jgi:delta-aminolevulinic acid dehydratase/porphobilinogen synthase